MLFRSNAVMEPPIKDIHPPIVDVKQFLENKVLTDLGTPKNFSHVNAINIFENRWRINVYTKEEGFITKRKIVNSFYCIWTGEELIASPQILNKY